MAFWQHLRINRGIKEKLIPPGLFLCGYREAFGLVLVCLISLFQISMHQSINSLDRSPPASAVRFAGRQSPDNRFVPKWQHWGVVDVKTLLRWKETLLSSVHFRKHHTCIATSHGGLVFLTKPLLHAQSCSLPIGRVLLHHTTVTGVSPMAENQFISAEECGWFTISIQFHNMSPTSKISRFLFVSSWWTSESNSHILGEGPTSSQGNRGNLTWNKVWLIQCLESIVSFKKNRDLKQKISHTRVICQYCWWLVYGNAPRRMSLQLPFLQPFLWDVRWPGGLRALPLMGWDRDPDHALLEWYNPNIIPI